MTKFHTTAQGRSLAYDHITGQGCGIVFLGGFRSDMTGSKAAHLANWAARMGRPFLRFDYSGHGQSSGSFTDGSIGDWCADAIDIITARTQGPQILVGSSMGGWIALLIARACPAKLAALIGIAAAPDFTEDSMWANFTPDQRAALAQQGVVHLPSEYAEPYPITARLIKDGRQNLVLRAPLALSVPTRLLQGTADQDVPASVALRLMSHIGGDDIRLTLVKDADHRFSSPACLDLITQTIADLPI
jgi:pimeloyl-ACP methyl ester carboxylesterase